MSVVLARAHGQPTSRHLGHQNELWQTIGSLSPRRESATLGKQVPAQESAEERAPPGPPQPPRPGTARISSATAALCSRQRQQPSWTRHLGSAEQYAHLCGRILQPQSRSGSRTLESPLARRPSFVAWRLGCLADRLPRASLGRLGATRRTEEQPKRRTILASGGVIRAHHPTNLPDSVRPACTGLVGAIKLSPKCDAPSLDCDFWLRFFHLHDRARAAAGRA